MSDIKQLECTSFLKTSLLLDEVVCAGAGGDTILPNSALSQKHAHMDRKNEAHLFSHAPKVSRSSNNSGPSSPWIARTNHHQSMTSSLAALMSTNGFTRKMEQDGSSYPKNSADDVHDHDGDDRASFAGRKFFVVLENNNNHNHNNCPLHSLPGSRVF
jgi:hypothetical protein